MPRAFDAHLCSQIKKTHRQRFVGFTGDPFLTVATPFPFDRGIDMLVLEPNGWSRWDVSRRMARCIAYRMIGLAPFGYHYRFTPEKHFRAG